jgi:hypothetical protein
MAASALPSPLPFGSASSSVGCEHLGGPGGTIPPKSRDFPRPDAGGYARISGANAPGPERGSFHFAESLPFSVKIPCGRRRDSIKSSRHSCLSTCPPIRKKRRTPHDRDRHHLHRSHRPLHNFRSIDDFCAEKAYWTRFFPSSKRVAIDPFICGRSSLPLRRRHRRRRCLSLGYHHIPGGLHSVIPTGV